VRVEGEEWTDAVVVGEVQEEMTEQRQQREGVEQAPTDGSGGLYGGFAGAPAMQAVDCSDDDGRFKRDAEEGVCDAAVMLEAGNWAANAPEGVYVGEFGSDGHSQCGVGGTAIKSRARKTRAGKDVRDRFHVRKLVAGCGVKRGSRDRRHIELGR